MHVETQSVPSRRLEWTVLSLGSLIVLKTNSGVIRGNIGWRFDTVSGEQPGGTLGAPERPAGAINGDEAAPPSGYAERRCFRWSQPCLIVSRRRSHVFSPSTIRYPCDASHVGKVASRP